MAYEKLQLLIDGQWCAAASGKTQTVYDPANGQVLGEVPIAAPADLERALKASEKGFEIWRAVPAFERQQIMERAARLMEERKETLAQNLTLEMGKPLLEARMEMDFTINVLRWYAEEGKRAYGRVIPSRVAGMRQMVLKEPLGPAAAFVAWNFPGVNAIRKIAAALGAGCSIIIKPSEETPATCISMARCFMEAGLPDGVLNVVYGVPDEVSRHLLASTIVRKVSFTGSVPVGKHLQTLAAQTLKRCTMELGGHAPFIVFDDANVKKAAELAVAGKFRNAGQICASPTRFYVQEAVFDQFVDIFVSGVKKIKVGNGLDEGVTMGPLIAARRLEIMDQFVGDAVEHGARLLTGGERLGNLGNFYAPTVLADVSEDARIMNEEPFGPVAPILPFKDFDEVVKRANKLQFGLASYAFTSNSGRAVRLADEIEAGNLAINSLVLSTPESPFGGINDSGYGSEGGVEGLEAYLRVKFVTETGA